MKNEMKLEFPACSVNEGLARITVAAFMSALNPTLGEVEDVKTAVSEAVTNCIIHGYEIADEEEQMQSREEKGCSTKDAQGKNAKDQKIYMECTITGNMLHIQIIDHGVGISDIKKAMEPLYTTKPELERSGMGFAFMEAFMDELLVESEPGKGTCIKMMKIIQSGDEADGEI